MNARRLLGVVAAALLLLLLAAHPGQDPVRREAAPQPAPTFATFDVLVDAGEHRLAAWQLDVTFTTAQLVGIEGGADAAFRDAPRYDPAALRGGRVVLAALAPATADATQLPTGCVLVARLHVMAPQGAVGDHAVRGVVAATADGERFTADVEVRLHEGK